MMADLIGAQFEAMRSGIRFQNPGIGDMEVEKRLHERMIQGYKCRKDWYFKKTK